MSSKISLTITQDETRAIVKGMSAIIRDEIVIWGTLNPELYHRNRTLLDFEICPDEKGVHVGNNVRVLLRDTASSTLSMICTLASSSLFIPHNPDIIIEVDTQGTILKRDKDMVLLQTGNMTLPIKGLSWSKLTKEINL
jgi:hypothetical protein